MSFGQAVRTVLTKYADFKGRASRSEYWWWVLFYFVGFVVFRVAIPRVLFLWEIAFLIPNFSVGARRMHDTDHSGWWYICPIVNIIFSLMPSTPGTNRFDVNATGSYAPTVTEAQLTSTSSACPTCGKLRLPGQNFCQGCGAKFE